METATLRDVLDSLKRTGIIDGVGYSELNGAALILTTAGRGVLRGYRSEDVGIVDVTEHFFLPGLFVEAEKK